MERRGEVERFLENLRPATVFRSSIFFFPKLCLLGLQQNAPVRPATSGVSPPTGNLGRAGQKKEKKKRKYLFRDLILSSLTFDVKYLFGDRILPSLTAF